MAKFTLQNVRLFTGGADLTTRNNKIDLGSEVDEADSTAFVPTGDAWREVLGGIRSTKLTAGGQWEAGDPGKVDDVSFADLGGLSAVTVCPQTAGVGSLAWLTSAMRGSYKLGDAVGAVAPWEAELAGNWPLVRGVVLHDPGTARGTGGTGTAVLHLPASAGQYVYAALHVLSLTGTGSPSITVKLQADNAAGFASPVDVLSFTPATARGGQILRTPGPLADSHYRASWTVSGTSPSALFLLSVGVQ